MERLKRRDGNVSGASVDTFKNLIWVIAVTIGLLFLIGSRVSTLPENSSEDANCRDGGNSGIRRSQFGGDLLHLASPHGSALVTRQGRNS
jgi:hypothetical protein